MLIDSAGCKVNKPNILRAIDFSQTQNLDTKFHPPILIENFYGGIYPHLILLSPGLHSIQNT